MHEQSQTVDGYCPRCHRRVALRLTRLAANPTTDEMTAVLFTGVCEKAGHPLREIDARSYWR